MKKLLSVFLAAVMLLSASICVFADSTEPSAQEAAAGYNAAYVTKVTDFSGMANLKDVTKESYETYTEFYIDSAEGMVNFSALIKNSCWFNGKTVYLKNDIDMSTVTDFEPIGTATEDNSNPFQPFRGTFDGQGYEIKNLTVTSSSRFSNALFGAVRGCIIRNLVIGESCSFSYTGTGASNTAALVAEVGVHGNDQYWTAQINGTEFEYPVLIENVCNKADVHASRGGCGGLVGGGAHVTNRYLYIKNCTNAGSVTNDKDSAGGICARMENKFRGMIIENCLNTGAVSSPFCAGGIFGDVMSNGLATRIIGCVNTGTVSSAQCAGAVCGQLRQANTVITGCTNYGDIKGTHNSIYGNIINGNTDNVTACEDKYTGSAEYEGFQSNLGDDGKIRLIASIDTLNYQKVGFKIVVKDGDGKAVQSIDQSFTKVYGSICGVTDSGKIEYSADDLREGGYLYALIIEGIPSVSYTFSVTPYSVMDGYTAYGAVTEFTYGVGA